MGAYSPFLGKYFALSNGYVFVSSNGINEDFSIFNLNGSSVGDISDAFIDPNSQGNGWIYGLSLGLGYLKTEKDVYSTVVIPASEYNAARSAAGSIILDGSTGATPTPPASTSPVVAIEANLDLTGHQGINFAAATTPTGAVILSQLEDSIGAVTTAYQAADLAIAGNLNALEVVVANLPQGITMAQVQSAIDAKVAEAVLAEVIDDAQAQAIVDAALAVLNNLDATILGRLTGAEGTIADNQQRLSNLEAHDLIQDANIGALQYFNGVQDAAIGSLNTSVVNQAAAIAGLDTRVGAVEGSLVSLNNADTVLAGRASATELTMAAMVAAMLPVAVSVANGAVVAGSELNVPVANVAVSAINATHQSISITLPAGMSGQERTVKTSRLAANGSYVECRTGVIQNGDTYVISGLKESNGMGTLKISLGYAGH